MYVNYHNHLIYLYFFVFLLAIFSLLYMMKYVLIEIKDEKGVLKWAGNLG